MFAFRCLYLKDGRASAVHFEASRKTIKANVSDLGMFDINLGVFKNDEYTLPYGDQSFPIGVSVSQRIYLQLSIDSKDPRLAVLADRCHATPDPNPDGLLQYDLIRDGYVVTLYFAVLFICRLTMCFLSLKKKRYLAWLTIVIMINVKKLLDCDWLRAVQFRCNTSAKSVTPVQKSAIPVQIANQHFSMKNY